MFYLKVEMRRRMQIISLPRTELGISPEWFTTFADEWWVMSDEAGLGEAGEMLRDTTGRR